MKRTHFYLLTFLVVLLFVGISMVSMAEEAVVLKIEISDVVSNADARQIRRLLEPWADPKDVTFSTPVDKHGRTRHFTTVVEVKARQGVSKYSETHTFDVYNIMRQLNDSRFRGRHGTWECSCPENPCNYPRQHVCTPRFRPELYPKRSVMATLATRNL